MEFDWLRINWMRTRCQDTIAPQSNSSRSTKCCDVMASFYSGSCRFSGWSQVGDHLATLHLKKRHFLPLPRDSNHDSITGNARAILDQKFKSLQLNAFWIGGSRWILRGIQSYVRHKWILVPNISDSWHMVLCLPLVLISVTPFGLGRSLPSILRIHWNSPTSHVLRIPNRRVLVRDWSVVVVWMVGLGANGKSGSNSSWPAKMLWFYSPTSAQEAYYNKHYPWSVSS